MEVWMHAFAIPRQVADLARRVEDLGFDGLLVADSQNLDVDVWVELGLAAAAPSGSTSRFGAEPDRLRWAVEMARAAAPDRSPSLGAFLNVAVYTDRAVARDLVRGSVAIFARFAAEGAPPDCLSEVTRAGIERLARGYEESRHGSAAAPYAQKLEDDFIDRFALVGSGDEVHGRLGELAALGIERIVVVPGFLDADPDLVAEGKARFAEQVLPRLR
jgi:5,10-methylenetetrahydromethanopterin reductase